ncbi:MAG TPA: hypothetical protein VFE96_04210 [Candidatus Bathyarchaeia archaeon]|jgi:hypothetical protein|nr:hypothetical protein [Candidatus Bathyarchaeia archaeon]
MPQKDLAPVSSLADVLERMSEKDRAFNFDVTMEVATSSLRVGTVRIYGKVESSAPRKK